VFAGDSKVAETSERAAKSFAGNRVAAPLAQRAIEDLEVAVVERASKCRHADPEMRAALESRATRGAQVEAAETLEAERRGAEPKPSIDPEWAARQAHLRMEEDVGLDEAVSALRAYRYDEGPLP
jgi:hypothetical protein